MDNPFGQISLKKRQIAFVVLIAALMCFLGSVVNLGSDSSSAEEPTSSCERFYYDKLDGLEKQIYEGFDTATVENPNFTINVPGSIDKKVDEVTGQLSVQINNVFSLYKEDNLYKYWLGKSYSLKYSCYEETKTLSSDDFTVELTDLMLDYGNTNAVIVDNVAKIKSVISGYSGGIDTTSVFTKVQSIHSIVTGLLEYDKTVPDTMVPRNIATVFLGGSFDDPALVVCEGYAKAFKAICDYYDVPCIIVSGTGVGSTGSEGHMWNQVMIDGKWYLVDCTWDDQSKNMYSDFMLVGSDSVPEHFQKITATESHVIDSTYTTFEIDLTESMYERPSYEIRLKTDKTDCALLYYNSGQSIVVPYAPVKVDQYYTYTFAGWEVGGSTVRELPTVSGDETYIAKFSSIQKTYHIVFKDKYGTTYSDQEYSSGSAVTIPDDPTKKTDKYASYTFKYWSIDGETQVEVKTEALEDVTYIAVYEETLFHYTVTFKDYDDSQISTKSDYTYGASIVAPADPEREMTNTQVFTFKCWNTSPAGDGSQYKDVVEANITYYAIYTAEDRYYTVILKGADGAVIDESKYLYESTLVLPDSLVDAEWKTELPEKVTADATYTAKVSTVISPAGTVVLTSDSNTAAVSSKVISEMKSHSGGTFNLSTGTVTFDAEAVKSLVADQTIQVNKKSFSTLSDSARSQLGNAEVYEITFGANDSVFSAGSATVTIPYKLASGQSASDVKLFHVDGDNLSSVECRYYDGNVTFSTGHFSYYAIQIPDDSSSIVNLIKDNVVIIAILIFAIIGIALSYKFSKP